MVEYAEAIEDPFDGQLPRDIVGTVEHHIGVVEVPVMDLREHPTESKRIHTKQGTNT